MALSFEELCKAIVEYAQEYSWNDIDELIAEAHMRFDEDEDGDDEFLSDDPEKLDFEDDDDSEE